MRRPRRPRLRTARRLVLGPHIPHDPYRLTVHGYVLRIRCDTDGTGRRVMIGTQTHEGTQWSGLDACRLEPWGLSTPAVEEVRRLRGTVRPLGVLAPRTAPARPTAVARPVAAPQAHEDRVAASAALQQAIEADRSVSELRHHLTHAEAAVNGGASAAENELLRRATDLLLRKERGVGVSPPPAPARRRRLSRPEPRPARARSTAAGGARQAAEAVADLLDALDRRRGRLTPGEQQRLVARLTDKARQAEPWLTGGQRRKITAWKNNTPQAASGPGKGAAAPVSSPARAAAVRAAAPEVRGTPKPARREGIASARATDPDLVADAARDVLEHVARLGKTLPWDQLCAQVKGLSELSEEQQRRALEAASTRSSPPLAVLITTGTGMPHPHYLARQPGDGPAARAAWQQAVADVHASYRPGPPPPGARPQVQHERRGAPGR